MKIKLIFAVLCLTIIHVNNGFATKYIFVSNDLTPPLNSTFPIETIQESLHKAHSYIKLNLTTTDKKLADDITIYIRGGEYREPRLWWSATSAKRSVKIAAYQDEKPVFNGLQEDGSLSPGFLIITNTFTATNVTIEGLTIKNYLNAISLGTAFRCEDCSYEEVTGTSNNKILNNTFLQIGNSFSTKYQHAFSAIGLNNSSNNAIEGNRFYKIENDKPNEKGINSRTLIHAVYLAHRSSRNIIKNNYVAYCSGDPFRIRNGSNNNLLENNYAYRSGYVGFAASWYNNSSYYDNINDCHVKEKPSEGNFLRNNIYTFPYLESNKKIVLFKAIVGETNNTFENGGNNFILVQEFYK